MKSYYIVDILHKDNGQWKVSCDAFKNAPVVEASKLSIAIAKLKEMLETECARMQQIGEQIPESDETAFERLADGKCMIELDTLKILKEENSEIVRRTISLPKWMDILIRNSEIDSSSVFREAVRAKLADDSPPIFTVEQLKQKTDPAVLKAYAVEILKNIGQ